VIGRFRGRASVRGYNIQFVQHKTPLRLWRADSKQVCVCNIENKQVTIDKRNITTKT